MSIALHLAEAIQYDLILGVGGAGALIDCITNLQVKYITYFSFKLHIIVVCCTYIILEGTTQML